MKYFALSFIGLLAMCLAADPIALSPEQRENVRAAARACIEQEQVTKEAVQELRAGNFANAEPKTKCFVNCFLGKLGFLAEGTPQDSVIKAKLGPIVGEDTINRIMTECNSLRGEDNCGTAFKLYECYYKNHAAIIQ